MNRITFAVASAEQLEPSGDGALQTAIVNLVAVCLAAGNQKKTTDGKAATKTVLTANTQIVSNQLIISEIMYHVQTCVKCGSHGVVIDTRTITGGIVKRRRECQICGYRWNTYEVPADAVKFKRKG